MKNKQIISILTCQLFSGRDSFGEKLVFYDKEEILNFILNRRINPYES